jgi:TetR/AcrR family transcriptional repressor of nem operon
MKVSREQAAANRERVIDVASRLFRERGLDGIGLDGVMQGAGLTHGGFYKNFASKEDLAATACQRAMTRALENWDAMIADPGTDALGTIASRYLSTRHRDDPGAGCVFAALGPDAARRGGAIRQFFTEGLGGMTERLARLLPGRSAAQRRERALATMASLVGAMVLARAVDDPALSEEILTATAKGLGTARVPGRGDEPSAGEH